MKKLILLICLFMPFVIYAQTSDATVKLNSTAGQTAFVVQDSAGVKKAQIDSAGNLLIIGTATVQGNRLGFTQRGIIDTSSMTIQLRSLGQEIVVNRADGSACFVIKDDYNFYPRVYERRIYDDAANYTLAVATHMYIAGTLAVGTAFPNRLELWPDSGDMRIGGGDLQLGPSWNERIYYDSTYKLIGISTNAYVAGTLGIGSNQILDSVGTRVITTASDATANTTVTTIHGNLRVNGNNILDSGGNTRMTLATSGDNVTFTGQTKISGQLIVTGSTTVQGAGGLGVTYGVRAATLTLTGNQIFDSANTLRITLGDPTIIGGTLRINDNDIQDSGGNVRVTFATSGDNVTFTGQTKVSGQLIVTGSATVQTTGIALGTSGKRNILDDSTKFAIRLSSNVYLDGALSFGIVVSTYSYATDWFDAADNTTFTDLSPLYGTLNVTVAPATIFVFASVVHNSGGSTVGRYVDTRILVGSTEVGYARAHAQVAADQNNITNTMVGALRVTTPGNYVVKVQYLIDAAANLWIGPRSMVAFWIGTP